ncbi:DUF4175 domain-containing protein [Rariglobus hedericola]|uniref:DUF4175 domain-containing protein n=1 Tax=Rariglobus hedericola TaxID=2597822 RepID=A0A556QS48_9BACT|nr:DUF4175 domain-containing protein [Rariglobus hedericola]TSJ79466.1 DUF4175 domain-containing protein [Rariglobus hedericola]
MSAPLSTSALPAPLRNALTRVAGKHLALQVLIGLAWLVISAALLLVAQTLLDRLMDFPRAVRVAFLVLDAGVLGAVFYRKLIRPWRRRWHATDAAFAIQRQWPALGSRVISAVQLANSSADGRGAGSPLLVQALVQETAAQVPALPLGLVVPAKPAVRRVFTAIILSATIAALAWWQWPLASVLLRRVALADIPLPTNTVVEAETRDLNSAAGSNVTLSAFARGVIPPQGRLELALAGGERRTILVRPDNENPARFAFVFENIQKSFTYRFYLGDGRGPVFKVTALPAPLLEQAEFIQEFPAYTRRPPLRQPAGALTLFPGSKIRVVAQANQPVKSIELRFAGDDAPAAIPLSVDADAPKVARGEFTVPAAGFTGLSLPLVSAEGIASTDSTVYPVRMETDRVPTVRIDEPTTSSETIVSTARLAVRARVRDDFALAKVELVTEVAGGAQSRRLLTVGDNGVVSHTFIPVSETPPLTEGAQLTWWIEATDNNNVTGPGIGTSERKQLAIVSFTQKQEEMLKRLEETSRRMEDVARRQSEVRGNLGDALRRNDEKTP